MRTLLGVILICWCGISVAQYKCTVKGKAVYSDAPCAVDARYVGALEDSVSDRAQADAAALQRKQAAQRSAIDRRDAEQTERNQRTANNQFAAEQAHAANAERNRNSRCSSLQYDINANQRGVARYQDFGWQRSLTQQENELKRNREAFDRDCR